MIKLLVLCLLATLHTGESGTTSNITAHSEPITKPTSHPSTTTDTKKTTTAPSKTTARPVSESHNHTNPMTDPLTCHCTGGDCQKQQCTAKASTRFCVTTAEDNTLNGSRSSTVDHFCGNDVDFCNVTITITLTEHIYWRSRTICCTDTNCNSQSLSAPSADTTPSKLVCPSCFAVNKTHCTGSPMKCAASETKCIDVTGTVMKGSNTETFAGQGCATPSAKKIKNGIALGFGTGIYSVTHSTMRNATDGASQIPSSVPFTFLLSSFVGLLQAKFIY